MQLLPFSPQVLKMVSVPEAVAAASMAAAHSLHARDHSAEHQPSKPQQRSKRKREDDESPDEPPRDEMAVVKIQNESGAEGGSAEQRATEEAAELRGVVEWCCQRLVWNMLQLQLQVPPLSCYYSSHEVILHPSGPMVSSAHQIMQNPCSYS